MKIPNSARAAKHQAHLIRKSLTLRGETLADAFRSLEARRMPREFNAERHRCVDGEFAFDYFLNRVPEAVGSQADRDVPRRIFTAWTDENALTPNRLAGLESLQKASPDIEVVLVTPENLDEWVIEGAPLHPAYEYLSAVHRSDYLRAYLMHHHGGGWSDLKQTSTDWSVFFDAIDADPDIWVLGYPENHARDVAFQDSAMGKELRTRYRQIAANCAFVVRPGTSFGGAWLEEVEARLDYYRRALERHPAVDPFGREGQYPLPWAVLQGYVFQPLQLRFGKHIALDGRMRPADAAHR